MKRALRILFSVIFGFAVLLVSANLYFHYWLQHHLPQYIENKSPYHIHYQDLNIEFVSGNISASKVKITPKITDNQNVLQLNGTVDSLFISNLGIYDAILNKKINAKYLKLFRPNLQIVLPENQQGDKKSKQPLISKNLMIEDGNIEILRFDKSKFLSIKNLSLNIENLKLTEKEESRKLPIVFDQYSIKSKAFHFYPDEVYHISATEINTENGQMSVKDFSMKPLMNFSEFSRKFPRKSLFDIFSQKMNFKDIVMKKNKISLFEVRFSEPNLTMYTSENQNKNKNKPFTYIVELQNVFFDNGKAKIIKNGQKKFSVENLKAHFEQLVLDEKNPKNELPFRYDNYQISGRNIFLDAGKFYQFFIKNADFQKNSMDLRGLHLQPKFTKTQFTSKISTEKDWYNVKIAQTRITDFHWKLKDRQPKINVDNVLINNLQAQIYRSKSPKDDLTRKKLYSELLRSIKFPLLVKNLNIRNSNLIYEEDLPNGNKPGKLTFSQFNLNAQNLNSNKGFKNTVIPIKIHTQFMNVAPMKVNWSFDTANLQDDFSISGQINDLPAESINAFVTPYSHKKVEGNIHEVRFNFKGNRNEISGNYTMKHENVKVKVLDEKTKKEKKLMSAVTNLIVRTNSKSETENVEVHTTRNPTKSFFNLLWKGVEEGLKKTLVGKNVEKIEKTVKQVKQKLGLQDSVNQKEKPKKEKGFLKKLFKK